MAYTIPDERLFETVKDEIRALRERRFAEAKQATAEAVQLEELLNKVNMMQAEYRRIA